MKTFNKIFAMAAVAATSLFSAQPANAATTSAARAAGRRPTAKMSLKFADYYCSEWETIDNWIMNNPNRDKIVTLGIALHEGAQRKTLARDTKQQMIDDLVALGCDTPDIFWLLYHE